MASIEDTTYQGSPLSACNEKVRFLVALIMAVLAIAPLIVLFAYVLLQVWANIG